MDRKELKKLTKTQLEGKRGLLALIIFIASAINIATNFIVKDIDGFMLWLVLTVVFSIVSVVIQFGISNVFLNVVKEKEINVYDIFYGFKGKLLFKIIGLQLLSGLAIGLSALLLIIPGIIVGLMLSQAIFTLCNDEDKGIIECMKESKSLMDGHKGEFFVLQLSFIPWLIPILFTCGLASFYVAPYISAVNANFFLQLRNEQDNTKEMFDTL